MGGGGPAARSCSSPHSKGEPICPYSLISGVERERRWEGLFNSLLQLLLQTIEQCETLL